MRKLMIRLASIFAFLVLMPTFAGCDLNPFATEESLGISYDKIVCSYSWGGGFGTIYDTMGLEYIVHADNRITVETGTYEDYGPLGISKYSMDVQITEEQKQQIIALIKQNRLWTIGDTSNHSVLDAGSESFVLYNSEGSPVHRCGGYASNNAKIDNVSDYISGLIPREVSVEVSYMAEKIDKELSAEYEKLLHE